MLSALLLWMACSDDTVAARKVTGDNFDEGDTVPPVVTAVPVTTAQPFGQDVTIQAEASDGEDGAGIFAVSLHYRNETAGSTGWRSVAMQDGDGDGVYEGIIRGEDQSSGGINYYVEAIDRAQNAAYDPPGGVDDPLHFRLYVDTGM